MLHLLSQANPDGAQLILNDMFIQNHISKVANGLVEKLNQNSAKLWETDLTGDLDSIITNFKVENFEHNNLQLKRDKTNFDFTSQV